MDERKKGRKERFDKILKMCDVSLTCVVLEHDAPRAKIAWRWEFNAFLRYSDAARVSQNTQIYLSRTWKECYETEWWNLVL